MSRSERRRAISFLLIYTRAEYLQNLTARISHIFYRVRLVNYPLYDSAYPLTWRCMRLGEIT